MGMITRQPCLRATKQQTGKNYTKTGASPVTAVSIGSGSAALVGYASFSAAEAYYSASPF